MRLAAPKQEMFTPNMTPMIDIVFLLMTFFIMVINFSQAESNEDIHLPKSELAQPPEDPPSSPLLLQITEEKEIIMGTTVCFLDLPGQSEGVEGEPFSQKIREEVQVQKAVYSVDPSQMTIIIRADADIAIGFVQKVIQVCQGQGLEAYTLRAKQGAEEE